MSETAPKPDFLFTDIGAVGVLESVEDLKDTVRVCARLGDTYDAGARLVTCDLPKEKIDRRFLDMAPKSVKLLLFDVRSDGQDAFIASNVVVKKAKDVSMVEAIEEHCRNIAARQDRLLNSLDIAAMKAEIVERQRKIAEDVERIRKDDQRIREWEERIAPREAAAVKAEELLSKASRRLEEAEVRLREAHALRADSEWCLRYMPKAVKILTEPTGEVLTPDSWRRLAEGFDRSGLDPDFTRSFLLSSFVCLQNGRFLLLAGHVGVGKSTLVKRAAELLAGDQRFLAVRPGWLDPTDLLGYLDAQGRFEKGPLTKELGRESDQDRLLFVLLDEMNIARVENYAADLLACLGPERMQLALSARDEHESAATARARLRDAFDELRPALTEMEIERIERMLTPQVQNGASMLDLGKNTVFCGTLNVDDSTENLSPKMLDRSFLLRFAKVGASLRAVEESLPIELSTLRLLDVKGDDIERWNGFLASLSGLEEFLLPISHRVREDYLLFDAFGKLAEIDPKDVDASFAFGRILPRIRFFRGRVDEGRLKRLLEWLHGLPADGAIGEARAALMNMIAGDDPFVNFQNVCG